MRDGHGCLEYGLLGEGEPMGWEVLLRGDKESEAVARCQLDCSAPIVALQSDVVGIAVGRIFGCREYELSSG